MTVTLYEFQQVLCGGEWEGGRGDREDQIAAVFGVGVRDAH